MIDNVGQWIDLAEPPITDSEAAKQGDEVFELDDQRLPPSNEKEVIPHD